MNRRLNRMKVILLIIGMVFITNSIVGQDTLKFDSELSFNIKGKHILAALYDSPIACINCPSRGITDNPIYHFAIYSGIDYKGTINNRHSFETGLYLEERSFSGGNNTLKNLVVFPKLKISSLDTFEMYNKKFNYLAEAGDFWNEDLHDLIRFYNIDYQALRVEVGFDKYWVGFYVIGDLSKNIGFDLHELYKFSFGYKNQTFINALSLSVNELHDRPVGKHPTKRDINIANYTKYNFTKSCSIEAQFDFRYNSIDAFSMASGVKAKFNQRNLKMTIGVRYYNANFNKGYKSAKPRYRNGRNYVGNQLYPLKNYYRPINQWALLTNYQRSDILNLEVVMYWKKNVYKKINFISDIDFNLIYDISNGLFYYYPFYNIGLNMEFLENFVFAVTMTNKHMNLDSYYQTSYSSKKPMLSYSFKMNLDKIQLKTMYFNP